MFRSVRKKVNEISTDEAKELLRTVRRGILAVNGDDDYPYAVPINFYYDEELERIYFHSSGAGYKVEALNKCDKICFTVYGNETVKDEAWAPYVKSALVFGRCRPITDKERAMLVLKRFAMKYFPTEELADEQMGISAKAVRMYEIEIEHLSGKQVQER